MADHPHFKQITVYHPALEELLAELRGMYSNGGAMLGCFEAWDVQHQPGQVLRSLNPERAIRRFVASETVALAFPELWVQQPWDRRRWTVPGPDPEFEQSDPLLLDDQLAGLLTWGGAYSPYRDIREQAKDLGARCCEAMFGYRYEAVAVYVSWKAWAPWFRDVAWDSTWVVMDFDTDRLWLLCCTDTD